MAPSLAMMGAFPVRALNVIPSAAYWFALRSIPMPQVSRSSSYLPYCCSFAARKYTNRTTQLVKESLDAQH
jgi:hypothetical protein